jgi:hypothetical protein
MSEQQTLTQEQVKKVLETSVSVKVSFLSQLEKIINVCSKRGAFEASELKGVGLVYDTLTGAIEEVKKQVAEVPKEDAPMEKIEEEVTEEK